MGHALWKRAILLLKIANMRFDLNAAKTKLCSSKHGRDILTAEWRSFLEKALYFKITRFSMEIANK